MQEREEMILLVLRDNTALPNVKQRIDVFSLKGMLALNSAQKDNVPVFAVKQNCTKTDIESEEDLCEFGTVCNIVDVKKNGNGISVTLEGLKRARLEDLSATAPFYKGGIMKNNIMSESPNIDLTITEIAWKPLSLFADETYDTNWFKEDGTILYK